MATLDDLDEAKAVAQASEELAGPDYVHAGKLVLSWDMKEVEEWLLSLGFKQVVPIFQDHTIDGIVLPKLNDYLLLEMGVTNIGIRVQLMNEINKIQTIARAQHRNEVVWKDEQYRPGPCSNTLPFGFPFCCLGHTCYGHPQEYTLTQTKLNILHWDKRVNIPGCCCGYSIKSNNVDLQVIHDVDSYASSSVAGDPLGRIFVSTLDGKKYSLEVPSSKCLKVTVMLNNTRDEALIYAGQSAISMLR
ncbi:hypothetical protein B484DRAFT_411989 [Ochromonadaceae sp. CCMP2298]|nr:hypothetical protein B484DRAFT_411989 [Ochromonadaceae sp. CCMP2298]|mmetsp:Transcript_6647/g.14557  ORF Transcript_6647/g.14557 Transcript_6647/m.14557 type:complete len:246 (-) Transcript_6647:1859-2596(-)